MCCEHSCTYRPGEGSKQTLKSDVSSWPGGEANLQRAKTWLPIFMHFPPCGSRIWSLIKGYTIQKGVFLFLPPDLTLPGKIGKAGYLAENSITLSCNELHPLRRLKQSLSLLSQWEKGKRDSEKRGKERMGFLELVLQGKCLWAALSIDPVFIWSVSQTQVQGHEETFCTLTIKSTSGIVANLVSKQKMWNSFFLVIGRI